MKRAAANTEPNIVPRTMLAILAPWEDDELFVGGGTAIMVEEGVTLTADGPEDTKDDVDVVVGMGFAVDTADVAVEVDDKAS